MAMKHRKRDEVLNEAIKALPELSPDAGLWDAIEERLPEKEGPKKRPYLAWAAAVAILVSASLWLFKSGSQVEGITYTQELSVLSEIPVPDFLQDAAFMDLLEDECVSTRLICEEQGFQDLMLELDELRTRANEVVQMANETGYGQFLMKAKSRLEKEDAELKKRIIAYLRNS